MAEIAGCQSCPKLKERYSKMVENRNALRKAVKLLEDGFDDLQKKYDQLQKDAQKQVKFEKAAKDKELAVRSTLEKELLVLKDQLSKYQQKESSDNVMVEEQNRMLNSCISEKESEIKRLEELLANEKKRVQSEKKKVEVEKKKAEEERRLLEMQKKVAEDQKRLAETERNKAAKLETSFNRLKVQLGEVSKKLEEERSKVHSFEASSAEQKQKTARESIQADRELEKAKDLSKALEEERKKTRDQKINIDNLKKQLESEKQKRELVEKKLLEVDSARKGTNDQTLKDLLSNERSRAKLLQDRIKLEKKRARLARREARYEKAEKLSISKQLHLLKQDHIGLSFQLKMLGDQVSQRVTGTSSQTKDIHFHTSGCACIRLKPSTEAEFDYPTVGSAEKKLHNSTVCSTSTTFSDVELESSQLQDTAMVNTSSFADSLFRQSISKVPDESFRNIQVENITAETDARGIYRSMKDVYINTVTGQRNQNDSTCSFRSKTNIRDAKKRSSKCSRQRQYDKHQEQQILSHPNKKCKFENQCIVVPCFSPKHQVDKTLNICQEESTIVKKQSKLVCAETMSLHDCMKLLELDDSDDERRFREAIERPLSPTLPDIKFLDHHTLEADDFDCLDGEFKTSDNFECSHAFDVIELEISSNDFSVKVPVTQEVIGDDSSRLVVHASEESKLNNVLLSPRVFDDHKALPENHSSASHGNVNVEVANACSESREQTKMTSVRAPHCISEELNLEENLLVDADLSSYIEGGNDALIKNSASSLKPERLDKAQENDHLIKTGSINIQVTDGQEECHSTVVINDESPSYSDTRKSLDLETGFPVPGKSSESITKSVDSTSVLDKYMSLSIMGQFEHRIEKFNSYKGNPSYLVVFSDNSNIDCISRIVQACNYVIIGGESEKDCLVVEALHGLALEVDVQPEEKVCVFLSSLLNRICDVAVANSRDVAVGDILRSAKSFATDISRVFSDVATRWLFQDICQLDILVNLVEDFLVRRKVLMCHDHNSGQSCLPSSSTTYQLKEQSVSLTEADARTDQLIAASVLLAYISALLDQNTILHQASYKILRNCKNDVSSNLLVLHLFSFVCGEEFLAAEKHLSAMVIKEVVSLLEEGHHSLPFLPSPLKSLSDDNICFPPCEQCPFSKNISGMEKFVWFLMDVLEDITSNGSSVLGNSSCVWKGPGKKCYHTVCEKINTSNNDGFITGCDTSCMLYKYRKQATYMPDWAPKKAFCYFTNVVSMVELSACYMSWEWNSSKIVPRLLKILQSRPDDDLSAGLIVLIGQISRFAVDFVGYDDTGVAKLRLTLSSFLDKYRNEKSSYCNQLAILGSLVNLLPVTFKEIIDGGIEDSLGDNQSFIVKLVKDWFTQLGTEHQVLALGLFK